MSDFLVEFYQMNNGKEPAKDFLQSIPVKIRAKMTDTIALLQDNGNQLREPYSKHLSEGIFELRAKISTESVRVLYFFYVGRCIVLTNGFVKKTNKTPLSEIIKAKKYRADYLKRFGGK